MQKNQAESPRLCVEHSVESHSCFLKQSILWLQRYFQWELFIFEVLMWQLPQATATWALQNQKVLTEKKKLCRYTIFKNVFPSSPSKWKRSSTRARDQKYQHKPKCGHTCCVHTCCRDVDNPGTRFKFFFQHEINHSPLLFRRTHFLKHRAVT